MNPMEMGIEKESARTKDQEPNAEVKTLKRERE